MKLLRHSEESVLTELLYPLHTFRRILCEAFEWATASQDCSRLLNRAIYLHVTVGFCYQCDLHFKSFSLSFQDEIMHIIVSAYDIIPTMTLFCI